MGLCFLFWEDTICSVCTNVRCLILFVCSVNFVFKIFICVFLFIFYRLSGVVV